MQVFYIDKASNSSSHMIVTYTKLNLTTGNISPIAHVDTNMAGCTKGATTGFTSCYVNFSDTFDNTTYAYYVDVQMTTAGSLASNVEYYYAAVLY